MNVLKIDSSARLHDSHSRLLTDYIVQQLLSTKLAGPDIIERDLIKTPFTAISGEDLMGVHGSSNDPRSSLQQHLRASNLLIEELKACDTLVFGVSMINFTVSSALKQWIDYICRAGITFQYGSNGPEGLSGVKRAFIVTATGGTPVGSDWDHASRYLEQICRFIGVEDIHHIDAGGSKGDSGTIINQGKQQIDDTIENLTKQAQAININRKIA